ncbi:AAA family ATPase [Methylomonas rhizoryzae]|uniref:AAA family ATPase n=1 Tax=Methylomonas rhizoryzae TaxID=2608981 RepID=UPI001231CB04|nr:AAA family ATPase [Methylomonas rhizoryzae]
MKINKLKLANFRCFEKYEIDFSDRFTLLIGDNGSGKTTILDSLSLNIQDLLSQFSTNQITCERSLSLDDMSFTISSMGQSITKEYEQQTFIDAEYTTNNNRFEWKHGRDSKSLFLFNRNSTILQDSLNNSATTISLEKQFSNLKNTSTILPIITYYGTARLWRKLDRNEIDTLPPSSRFLGYKNYLNPGSHIEQIFRWFKTQELAALQKNETRHVLEAVRNAIIEMIPGAKRVWWDVDWDEIRIETEIQGKTQPIPFHLLSDGYRNMIGMVADIAYRMATLNPQLEADVIKQTEGIVLIDEIDLHLHPKWQREVVGRLLNTFPKVQFVASSHSPFIIQSLYGREDCLLWDLEKAQPIAIESESIEDIAEEQQHVEIPQKSKRYLDMMDAAEAYYRKLHEVKNESDMEVMQLRSKLDELSIPFSDDPAFAAQLKFERDSVLASKDK